MSEPKKIPKSFLDAFTSIDERLDETNRLLSFLVKSPAEKKIQKTFTTLESSTEVDIPNMSPTGTYFKLYEAKLRGALQFICIRTSGTVEARNRLGLILQIDKKNVLPRKVIGQMLEHHLLDIGGQLYFHEDNTSFRYALTLDLKHPIEIYEEIKVGIKVTLVNIDDLRAKALILMNRYLFQV